MFNFQALGSENAALRGALLRLKALYEMRALAEGAEAEHRIRHLRTRLASQVGLWHGNCACPLHEIVDVIVCSFLCELDMLTSIGYLFLTSVGGAMGTAV